MCKSAPMGLWAWAHGIENLKKNIGIHPEWSGRVPGASQTL